MKTLLPVVCLVACAAPAWAQNHGLETSMPDFDDLQRQHAPAAGR